LGMLPEKMRKAFTLTLVRILTTIRTANYFLITTMNRESSFQLVALTLDHQTYFKLGRKSVRVTYLVKENQTKFSCSR